jgi:hypothetical protein
MDRAVIPAVSPWARMTAVRAIVEGKTNNGVVVVDADDNRTAVVVAACTCTRDVRRQKEEGLRGKVAVDTDDDSLDAAADKHNVAVGSSCS